MKILLSLVAGFFILQSSPAFANLQCHTSEGIRFSVIEDYNRDKDCAVNIIVFAGKQVQTEDADGCSYLSSFTGADGSKLTLAANNVGIYVYAGGLKVVPVNCDQEKK